MRRSRFRKTLCALCLSVILSAVSCACLSDQTLPLFSGFPTRGPGPLVVQFTAAEAAAYEWDFDSNGVVDARTRNPVYTYTNAGTYTVKLVLKIQVPGWPITYSMTQTRTNYIVVTSTGGATPSPGGTTQQTVTLYWGNLGDNTIRMIRSTASVLSSSTVVARGPEVQRPMGLQVKEGWLFWANLDENTIRAIQVGAPPGTSTVVADAVRSGVNRPTGLTLSDSGHVYWSNAGDHTIRRKSILGPAASTVVADRVTSGVFAPEGLQVVGDFLYWAEGSDDTIRRCRISGGPTTLPATSTVIAGPVVSSVNQPHALRVVGMQLYWTNKGDDTVRRCSLGSAFPVPSTIVAGPVVSGVKGPAGLAVLGGLLCWANYRDETLRACTLGNPPCQSVAIGTQTGVPVDEPYYLWGEMSNP